MKTKILIPVLLACSLALSGCQEKGLVPAGSGDEVVFGGTMRLDASTKTEYESPNSGSIRWSGGESIQIQSLASGEDAIGQNGTYSVVSQKVNRSSIGFTSGDKLRWRSAGYTFYGFYPASIGGSFSYSGGAETLSGLSVPATQSQNGIMSNLYMFARKQQNRSEGQGVELMFYPLVTTVGITVRNGKSEAITLSEVKLTSTGKDLCGTYSVSFSGTSPLADGAAGWPASLNSGGKTVTLDGSLTVASNSTETVYLLLAPQVYDAGTVTLSLTCGDKTYVKTLASVFQVSQLQPAHKYAFSVNIAADGQISLTDVSLGGAQMLLHILRNNISALQALNASLANKIYAFFNDWEHADERFNPNSTYFTDDSQRFTQEELELIQEFLLTVTDAGQSTDHQITSDIYLSDFAYVPNLQTIGRLQGDGSNSITIDNLDLLNHATLQYFSNVTISDCDELVSGDALHFDNFTDGTGTITIQKCKNLTSCDLGDMGNANGRTVIFDDNAKLESVTLTDAGAMTIQNSPAFKTLTMVNAGHLKELRLIETPLFQDALLENADEVSVTLQDCSTQISGDEATIRLVTDGRTLFRNDAESYNCDKVHAYVGGTHPVRVW